MTIDDWAQRWGVPLEALAELLELTSADVQGGTDVHERTEAGVQARLRVEAKQWSSLLLRNNRGVCEAPGRPPVRFGLGNHSAQLNRRIKSSDLIGITSVVIDERWLGRIAGIFTSVEVKRPGWHYRESDNRAVAQKKWNDIVRMRGGYGGFATGLEDLRRILMGEN